MIDRSADRGAVRAWLRSQLRTRRRATVGLVVLIGLVSGVSLAAASAARRVATAYPRFVIHARADDAVVGIVRVDDDEGDFLDQVEALPEVAEHARRAYLFLSVLGPDGHVDPTGGGQTIAAADDDLFRAIDVQKVVAGRAADPDRSDEVTISYALAQTGQFGVGDTIRLASWDPAAAAQVLDGIDVAPTGPEIAVRVVGVVVVPGELSANTGDNAVLHFTQTFYREYRDRIGTAGASAVRLRHGTADVPAFERAVQRLAGDRPLAFADQAASTRKTQRPLELQAAVLTAFATLAAITGLLIVAQAIARDTFAGAADYPVLAALGVTRGQLVGGTIARAAAIGAAGAAAGVGLAAVVSPYSPVEVARAVEPHPGAAVNLTFAAGMAVATAVAVVVVALRTASRSARRMRLVEPAPDRPSRVAAWITQAGAPPSAVAGVGMAFEPGPGRSSLPVRTTIAGVAVAVAGITAALVLTANVRRLIDTPRLFGYTWDATIGNPYAGDLSDSIVPVLRADRDVSRVSMGGYSSITVNGTPVSALALDPVQGTVTPPVLSGAAPAQPDEVGLGAKTMRSLGVGIGDVVTVRAGGNEQPMRVAARVLIPNVGPNDSGGLGEGALLTLEGLRRLQPGAPANLFEVAFAPGVDVEVARERLRPLVERAQIQVTGPIRPTDVENLRTIDKAPLLIALLLMVPAIATMAHALTTSIRRRDRDLAIMRALGFSRRQLIGTVSWQASTVAAVALAVGLPAGAAAGGVAWSWFADRQGIIADPTVPGLGLLLVVPAMLLMANLVAVLPGLSAASTRPAETLRFE